MTSQHARQGSDGAVAFPTVGLVLLDHDAWMGGTIYVRNLVYALDALPPDERPALRLIGADRARRGLVNDLSGFDFVACPNPRAPAAALAARAARRLRRALTGSGTAIAYDGVDVVFPALHTDHPDGVPHLYWIPDFQHEHMPALFSSEELADRRAKDAAIARAGAHLILSSRMALADFQRLYPDALTVPHVWSFCTTLSAHERGGREPLTTYGIPEKYLYIANQFWAHKNHETAFRALALLKESGLRIDVVCTGFEEDSRNADHVSGLKQYLAEAGLADQVHFLGLVPRNDQIEIFRHAAAVLQPSLFEGWSTVVEDAKALGRPLILSDFPVHREQLGDDGWFFPGRDAEALADLIWSRWPTLKPGPDPAAEAAAKDTNGRRRVAAARAFLAIASDAAGSERSG